MPQRPRVRPKSRSPPVWRPVHPACRIVDADNHGTARCWLACGAVKMHRHSRGHPRRVQQPDLARLSAPAPGRAGDWGWAGKLRTAAAWRTANRKRRLRWARRAAEPGRPVRGAALREARPPHASNR
jgi:hypothetical protein